MVIANQGAWWEGMEESRAQGTGPWGRNASGEGCGGRGWREMGAGVVCTSAGHSTLWYNMGTDLGHSRPPHLQNFPKIAHRTAPTLGSSPM